MENEPSINIDPVGGAKPTKAGKRPRDDSHDPPTAEEAGGTEQQTQARSSEKALEHALSHMPPG